MSQRISWKKISEERRKENFVGRREQLRVFEENFASDVPNYMVFAVTGEGGVGKSTLLRQFEHIASSSSINALAIACNDRFPYPIAAMRHVAAELAKYDIQDKEFDERCKKYYELREEMESDPKAPRSMLSVVTRGVSDFTIKNLRKVPVAGVFFDEIDPQTAGEALAELVNYGLSRWGNKDEVQLLREPERMLTPLFVSLLNHATERQRLILMFDVFERTSDTLASWLLALFRFEYGEFNTGITFVISGRDPLEQHWTELSGMLCHITLEPFTPEETRLYLSNPDINITDDRLVAQIQMDSGGLPVLVELLAATRPQPGVPLQDISRDAVTRFLQWTPQEERRIVAILAAIPRQFNRDILSAALNDASTTMFNWLSAQSYVRTDNQRGSFYHEKVRELMLRHLRNTSPNEFSTTHERLAKYFTETQTQFDLSGQSAYENDHWRKLECERVYHAVCAQPDRNFSEVASAFLHASRWRWKFSENIARVCLQAGSDAGSSALYRNGEVLIAIYQNHNNDRHSEVIEKLRVLELQHNLTPTARCEIHALRGESYRLTNQHERALIELDHAITLDEKYTWTIASRGETYRKVGKHEQAIDDFSRVIQLDEKYAWAFAHRGETYRLMAQYENAIADFDCAIALDKAYVWALAARGQAYRQIGNYEKSLTDLNSAIELAEKKAFYVAQRGETHRKMKNYDQALADFDRAIELDEKYSWAIACRGLTYRQVRRYDLALIEFNRAHELDPKNASILAHRGETYRLQRQYENALNDLNQSLTLNAKDAWTIIRRSQVHMDLGQYDKALTDLNLAIKLNDKDAQLLTKRGEVYRATAQFENALADFDCATVLDKKFAGALIGRGWALCQMGEYEKALAEINSAIELDSELTTPIGYRGEIHRRMKNYEKALADFDNVLERDEKDTFALTRRAATYFAVGNSIAAVYDIDKALQLPISTVPDRYNHAVAFALLKRHPEAIELLKQAILLDIDARTHALVDDLLDPLRSEPIFQELVNISKSP
ncbi:AAA family ATPase [candidate division KSB1 bacterium]|nr:AAA family ATPase [bacterium]NUM66768.1 AAA family ATPase [candidate division KSB1 bacterium]